MRLGYSVPVEGIPLREHAALAAFAEGLGYTDCWSLEMAMSDAFLPLAVSAAGGNGLRYGTAIASVFARGPALLATNAAQLAELAPGRFVLGIGTSSDIIVERWNRIPFDKPYTRLAETLDFLQAALAGERASGFKLPAPPAHKVPIILGSMRPRALRLAGAKADGIAINLVPADALHHVLAPVHEGARDAGRPVDELEVVQRVLVALGSPEEAERAARRWVIAYAQVEVYRTFFHSIGIGEALEPAVVAFLDGRRAEALELLPLDVVRQLVLWGSWDEIRAGLAAHAAAGVTTSALYFLTVAADPAEQARLQRDALERLAPTPA
jgi:probable F420-dependent oxidoreductase